MKETKDERKVRQNWEETQFVNALTAAGNIVQAEVLVAPPRKWRVDYLVTANERHVAVEIQGFGFGHVGRAGWLRDIEKAQAIAARGWLYCPVTREDVKDGTALDALARCGIRVTAPRKPYPVRDASPAGEGEAP